MKKNSKKSLDEMSVEELLEQLRSSQGKGDCLIEITPNGIKTTKGS
jgi:hypothetical protein